jgi:lipoyl(octanoyl) transferase
VLDCRLIIDPPASGAHNMAVDEALLVDAAEHNAAALRFYSWDEPTLSLGYFQRYADREQHTASSACAVVRRQTGGGAILHDRELTYSLALPASHLLTKQNEKLYRIVHEVFIEILSLPGHLPDSVRPLHIRGEGTKIRPADEPFLCFQRQSPGDVVIVAADSAENPATLPRIPASLPVAKILGSAQRRYRGALLQHGSLLLERSPTAPELKGWRDLADPTVAIDALITAAACQLGQALHFELHEGKLPPELESIADEIANSRYRSPAWTKRR